MSQEKTVTTPALLPPCNVCGNNQIEPGALLFGPPNSSGECKKFHICTKCYVADSVSIWGCK